MVLMLFFIAERLHQNIWKVCSGVQMTNQREITNLEKEILILMFFFLNNRRKNRTTRFSNTDLPVSKFLQQMENCYIKPKKKNFSNELDLA